MPGCSAHLGPSPTSAGGGRSCSLTGARGDSPWQSHCSPLGPEGQLGISFPRKISLKNHLWAEGFQSLIIHPPEVPGHLSGLSLFLPLAPACFFPRCSLPGELTHLGPDHSPEHFPTSSDFSATSTDCRSFCLVPLISLLSLSVSAEKQHSR